MISPSDKKIKIVWGILSAALIACGGLALLFFVPPFPVARQLADWLAKDHNLEMFSPALYARLRLPLIALGGLCSALGIASFVFARRSQAILAAALHRMAPAVRRLASDARALFRGADPVDPRWISLAVIAITLAGLLARLPYITRSMSHDEAYTFVTFAANSLQYATSDYSLPNNHILHTILVHYAFLLFGDAPWVIRLPALIAGLLVIPAAYGLARRLYNLPTALLAAAFCAAAPALTNYSTLARGYTMLVLLALLTWTLGTVVRQQANSAAWLLLGALGALGFYTVPVFLYPYAILFTWLLLTLLFKDTGPGYRQRWHFLAWMFAAGLTCLTLTILFYLPVFELSGVQSVIGNSTVSALTWGDFVQTFPHRLQDTWIEWTDGVSPLLTALVLVGIALSLVFHRRVSQVRIPAQVAAVLCLVPLVLLQRPNPGSRVWLDLFPLVLIWGAAGWLSPWLAARWKVARSPALSLLVCGVTIVVVIAAGLARSAAHLPAFGQAGEVEQIVQYLQANLKEGDVLVITEPDDAPLWYYWRRYQLSQKFLQSKTQPFQQAYVLVNRPFGQTVQQVLEDRGPGAVFVSLPTARLVRQFESDDLYVVDGNQRALEKAFGKPSPGSP